MLIPLVAARVVSRDEKLRGIAAFLPLLDNESVAFATLMHELAETRNASVSLFPSSLFRDSRFRRYSENNA